ncbi:hypothetical protein [Noviherbaspirillum suwonense]|jgi:hypothetical protein|uniref:Tail assembly chaperone n=1 Tax=Noviherbaspirillum suwonense TaxID=1224511 RepID=A0ABY1QIN0_9BURK|nr:hypothetical protein [Noviherbaspirillum suwonense]SMP71969.1 hypothetical protein SAMN06295970_117102 [Noviherbaspirillum suwonense]
MALSKEQILSAKDFTSEIVPVEAWGGEVHIRAMSGAERDAFRAAIEGGQAPVGKFEASLLALTLADEHGALLFTLQEVEALRGKSAAVLDKLAQEAMRINGMTAAAQEEAAKN